MSKKTSMKVAVISHAHPSISKGGGEISAYTLYQGLLALGIPAVFIAMVPQDRLADVVLHSAGEHVLPYDPGTYSHGWQLGSPALGYRLAELLRAEGVTVANFHHYINFGLSALRVVKAETKIPVILTLHEYLAICANDGQMVTRPGRSLCYSATPETCAACFPEAGVAGMATRQAVFKEAFAHVDAFISPSQFLIDRYVAWGLPRDQISFIENGLAGYEKPAVRVARPTSAPVTFAYFGQINPYKGMDVLLEAMELLAKDLDLVGRFVIRAHGNRIGLPPDFEARMDAAIAKHEFFEAPGPYDNRTIMQLMSETDYVLVPSRWWENSPVVIQEAFAARCPVICSDIGGMAEKVIDGVSGFHFRVGSARDLAATLRKAVRRSLVDLDKLPVPSTAQEMAGHYLHLFQAVGEAGLRKRSKKPATTAGVGK